jgi:hypothetical protein
MFLVEDGRLAVGRIGLTAGQVLLQPHLRGLQGLYTICTAMKIPLMYSFSGNSAASAPISTSWKYINHSQTHECGNWD